jgi:hypothetical protein
MSLYTGAPTSYVHISLIALTIIMISFVVSYSQVTVVAYSTSCNVSNTYGTLHDPTHTSIASGILDTNTDATIATLSLASGVECRNRGSHRS